jgi:EF-hand domain-containing protein 1
MKHKNEDRYLVETDFQIGSVVKLGAFYFQLVRADEFTANYMASNPTRYPESDLRSILARIDASASKQGR